MAELYRYAAFISYSSKDAAFAKRLHGALESYGIPSSLGKFDLIGRGKRNRIYPVFRDRDELAAKGLGEQIDAALRASASLIVVSSPNSVASEWVGHEIDTFVQAGRRDRIFAIVPDTAPLLDPSGADATAACLPKIFHGDALAGVEEQLAGDARKGKDGFRNAWLKVVAGMIGVTPGQIVDRDKKQRARRRTAIIASAFIGVSIAGWLSASVAASDWRHAAARAALAASGSGRTLNALPFAIAGVPPSGAVLRWQGDGRRSHEILLSLGGAKINSDLGKLSMLNISASGNLLVETGFDIRSRLFAMHTDGSRAHLLDISGYPASIASDGSVVLMRDQHGAGTMYASDQSHPPISVGNPGAVYKIAFSQDHTVLFIQRRDGVCTLYMFADGGRPMDLGKFETGQSVTLSSNGLLLLLRSFRGQTDVFEIAGSVRHFDLGITEAATLSEDGRFLLVKAGNGQATLHTLSDNSRTLVDPFKQLALSARGDVLLMQREDGRGAAFKLGLSVAQTDLGDLGALHWFTPSPDGSLLFTQNTANAGFLYDIGAAGGRRTELGDMGDVWQYQVSDNGVVFVQNTQHLGAVFERGHRTNLGDLGQLSRVVLARNGSALVAQDMDLRAVLFSRASGWRRTDLGILNDFNLSLDGSLLVTQDRNFESALYNPAVTVSAGDGARRDDVFERVCALSENAVQPFRLTSPGPGRHISDTVAASALEQSLSKTFRGHPRNPCDWRGILTILPNAENGDGWFEGPRQWLKLIAVQLFGAKDYNCADATFGTMEAARNDAVAASRRRARQRMCDLYGAET